jgi:hypothetical protein
MRSSLLHRPRPNLTSVTSQRGDNFRFAGCPLATNASSVGRRVLPSVKRAGDNSMGARGGVSDPAAELSDDPGVAHALVSSSLSGARAWCSTMNQDVRTKCSRVCVATASAPWPSRAPCCAPAVAPHKALRCAPTACAARGSRASTARDRRSLVRERETLTAPTSAACPGTYAMAVSRPCTRVCSGNRQMGVGRSQVRPSAD